MVRALPCHGRGCGFESRQFRIFSDPYPQLQSPCYWIQIENDGERIFLHHPMPLPLLCKGIKSSYKSKICKKVMKICIPFLKLQHLRTNL